MINRRKILFTPEIGDWTLYTPEADSLEISIGTVGVSKFDRLSREDLVAAHKLHYLACESLAETLLNLLKIKVDLYSVEVNQLPFGAFFEQNKDNLLQATVDIEGNHRFKMYFQHSLANVLIDRSLGGEGRGAAKVLSEIEHELFSKVIAKCLTPFIPLWNIDESKVSVSDVQSNVKEDLSLTPQHTYIVFIAKLGIGNSEPGYVMFGYSRETLTELLIRAQKSEKQSRPRQIELKKSTLDSTRVKLTVEVGSTELTMKELMSLSVGDIIKFDRPIGDYLQGDIGDAVYFTCFPGTSRDRYAVQLLQLFNRQEDIESGKETGNFTVQLPVKGEAYEEIEEDSIDSGEDGVEDETYVSEDDPETDLIGEGDSGPAGVEEWEQTEDAGEVEESDGSERDAYDEQETFLVETDNDSEADLPEENEDLFDEDLSWDEENLKES